MDLQKIDRKIRESLDEMIQIRRHLHMNPELSFEEEKTPEYIANYLEALGIEVRRHVGGRGVVGTIRGGRPGKTIAFRADFDALPIQEATDVPYKSAVPGVMHACGHDGHTASLLVFAKVMNEFREELVGNIVLIHQHAEEVNPGGALGMIEDGCLDGVDMVFGAHLQSLLPAGLIYSRDGYLQAAENTIRITVTGKGTHGAEPHNGHDPILAAAHIMTVLQSVVSRNADPLGQLVISIGQFHSGSAGNVIPQKAEMEGTMRVFDEELRQLGAQRIREIAEYTAKALGCTAEADVEYGYDAVKNHTEGVRVIEQAVASVCGDGVYREIDPVMPAEDFAYYLQHRPGAYFFVGAKVEDGRIAYPHHHEKFDFHEPALAMAARTFAGIFIEAQKQN
ncbi:N-acyl-L-amino acid amidohydrolase [Bhargavaea cecembensis DSE10]|uniref:N-acyl-L-amino acid amidohydrolase n=1 Tax=Bhargavaea cecembensis DSE10 TaxID=1235279 RepID=M7P1P3_9BACL|nr:amidohydrolase [Bhargavaea cecembensis]EMR07785.1 N-acyl-L-amino acid amidohydrolase [Bhargavaea cecembensis DSE10]